MRIALVTRSLLSVISLTCFQVYSFPSRQLPMPPRPRTTIRCPTCLAGPFASESSLRRHRNHGSKLGDRCSREIHREPAFTRWEPAGPAAAGRVRELSPLRPTSPELGDDLSDPPPGYADDEGVGQGGRRSPGPAAPPPQPPVCTFTHQIRTRYKRICMDMHRYSRILTNWATFKGAHAG